MAYDIAQTGFAQPVVIAVPTVANGATGGSVAGLPVTQSTSSLSTVTVVASVAVDILILAANTARRGATIYNTDANPLQIVLGAGAASSVNFSVQIASGGYYEVPFGYSGVIRGIWLVDGAGFAFVTEFV